MLQGRDRVDVVFEFSCTNGRKMLEFSEFWMLVEFVWFWFIFGRSCSYEVNSLMQDYG